MTYCKGCLSKQQKINELEEEITPLKSKLHYQERTAEDSAGKYTLAHNHPPAVFRKCLIAVCSVSMAISKR
jgi:hypothetical protein